MIIQIEEEEVANVQSVLSDYFGLGLSAEQVGEFLKRSPDVCTEIASFGPFDTETRSAIVNALCCELGVGRWPINQDGEEAWQKFRAKLALAAELNGYTFNPED